MPKECVMKEDKPTAKGEHKQRARDAAEEMAGTHALAATAGAVGGAVVGAIAGIGAGPLGSLVGAAGGAVLGGALAASTGVAPPVDTAAHEAHWREHFASRPYVPAGADYEEYAPAYRYGALSYAHSDGTRSWDDVEAELSAGWDAAKDRSRLAWDDARHAARDAWERMKTLAERPLTGGSDNDR
jgi:hypothetical protein